MPPQRGQSGILFYDASNTTCFVDLAFSRRQQDCSLANFTVYARPVNPIRTPVNCPRVFSRMWHEWPTIFWNTIDSDPRFDVSGNDDIIIRAVGKKMFWRIKIPPKINLKPHCDQDVQRLIDFLQNVFIWWVRFCRQQRSCPLWIRPQYQMGSYATVSSSSASDSNTDWPNPHLF